MTLSRSPLLTAFLSLATVTVSASADEPRQGYGPWEKTAKHYFHRDYAFKPTPGSDYEIHRVIWYPSQPEYYYYWNPKSRVFWGRAIVESAFGCRPLYQLLPPEARKCDLKDIPDKAFGVPAAPPKLGDISGGVEKVAPNTGPQMALPIDEPPAPFTRGPA